MRSFVHEGVSVFLYDDDQGTEGFLCERAGRVVGRVSLATGETFTIEPCNNWENCHVWKHFHYQSFTQETNEPDTDYQVIRALNDSSTKAI